MPVDFSIAWNTASKILSQSISLLPNIVLGLVIFVLFLLGAALANRMTRRWVQRSRTH